MAGFMDGLGIHAQSLVLRSRRNDILASNIANAATPNFKARDIDFDAALRAAVGQDGLRVTNAGHMSNATTGRGAQPMYRQPVSPSLDGNTVELSVEQMAFSENVTGYQTSLSLLNRRISGMMSAIRGE